MEWLLFLIALQLAFISTAALIGTVAVVYHVLTAPPSSPTLPFLIPLGDDISKKMMPPEAPKGAVVPHTTGGMYA